MEYDKINASGLNFEINKVLKDIQNSNIHSLKSFFCKNNIHWTQLYYDKTGDTVLHFAARLNLVDVIDYLLNNFQPKTIDCKNKDDKTPLHEASQFGQFKACELLTLHGADVNALKRADWTPLMLACTKITENRDSRLNIIELLLNNGGLVNYKNKDGWTCIHLISREGDIDIFNLLIRRGAHTTSRTKNGRTGLHIASLHGNLPIVESFLRLNVNVNTKDNCGNTPLHEAVLGNHLNICRKLIEHGANIAIKNNCDYSLIHLAASEGHLDIIKFILDNLNCDINETNKNGLTALHCAARTKQHAMYNFLVENGAKQTKDKFNRTPLDYQCYI